MINKLKVLLSFSGKYKILSIIGCILSAISAIFLIVPFLNIYNIIEEILLNMDNINVQLIWSNAYSLLYLTLFGMFIYFIALMCTHLSAFENERNMKNQTLEHVLNLPLGYFSNHTSGSIRKNIENSSSETESFLAHMVPDLMGAIVTPIVFLILLFYIDWKLGIVCIIPIIFGFYMLSRMFTEDNRDFMMEYNKHLETMNSEAVEYLRGIPVTKTFQQSIYSYKNFHHAIIQYGKYVKNYSFSMQFPMTGFTLSVNGFFILLIPVAILMATNPIDVKFLINLIFYVIFTPLCSVMINKIMMVAEYWMIATQAVDRITTILDEPVLPETTNPQVPKNNSITLNNVVFDYEKNSTDKHILNNVNMHVNEGNKIALVGPSGSGKSTIAQLISRFWDVDSGEIKIGEVNIKNISKKDLNNQISFVFQDSKLFHDSIYNNLTMGKNYSMDDINKALKLAQCQDIIEMLPNGLDTVIKEEGLYLSGGEQQRLVLARALLKDSPIIILDEATAFADPDNELAIQKAINEITKNKTVITIAHRLTTIKNVDKIFVINEGQICEEGTHTQLLEINGLYKRMWDEYNKAINWKINNSGVDL